MPGSGEPAPPRPPAPPEGTPGPAPDGTQAPPGLAPPVVTTPGRVGPRRSDGANGAAAGTARLPAPRARTLPTGGPLDRANQRVLPRPRVPPRPPRLPGPLG
eukprot:5962610-Lingulodinium_polyedra.AAC.1